jgi:hypothetical protein
MLDVGHNAQHEKKNCIPSLHINKMFFNEHIKHNISHVMGITCPNQHFL